MKKATPVKEHGKSLKKGVMDVSKSLPSQPQPQPEPAATKPATKSIFAWLMGKSE